MQSPKRSYAEEVIAKIKALPSDFKVEQYGSLSIDPERYPLFCVKVGSDSTKPTVLVTGGVHGYETSGVQGALLFLKDKARAYSENFNIVVAPCVSPWGYECIQRWTFTSVDPNRSFAPLHPDGDCEEAHHLMGMVRALGTEVCMHIDCHETTDTDESEFRPAKAARDGTPNEPDTIPDGFYLVGDAENPQAEFQKCIIDAVREVTHIAPPDSSGNIIGEPVYQDGVINIPSKKYGLCAGQTNAKWTTTTEVYPDSPKATPEICNLAQVAVICSALGFAQRALEKAKL